MRPTSAAVKPSSAVATGLIREQDIYARNCYQIEAEPILETVTKRITSFFSAIG